MVDSVLIFALGVFAWTFVEYLIHGWLSHTFNTFAARLHAVHHRDPNAVFTIGAWIPIAALWLLGMALFAFAPGMIFFTGMVMGFVAYEAIHYRIHFRRPHNVIETQLRTRHLLHHDYDSRTCFGVTSGLWDLVFGTESIGPDANRRRLALAATPPFAGPTNIRKIALYLPLLFHPR